MEQKKGVLELIEGKNMKIRYKNIRHGRASKVVHKSEAWHGPCLWQYDRARSIYSFLLFCSQDWHGPCLWWHGHAKVPGCNFELFSDL